MSYQLVVGLETHIELATKSKLFCSCTTQFGAAPNTHCCEVCMGHPGALPVINRKAVRLAVTAGLALGCKVNNLSFMDRKNYSYPDSPKAYQISQFDVPLCEGGSLTLKSGKVIGITRIHIEDDAGKLIHRDNALLADYNRCGVPLIEIVTEPDFTSSEEVADYVDTLRQLMRYIGVSDCKMQEGSMRCDVNISVRESQEAPLGVRTEIKNMNSVSNIVRAIEFEYLRQCKMVESGGMITQETRRFDDTTGTVHSMRSKESTEDYRFFRDPDLPPVYISEEEVESVRRSLPELPEIKTQRYTSQYGLSLTDARHLTKYRRISEYFEQVISHTDNYTLATKYILGQIFSIFSTEEDKEQFSVPVKPHRLAELVNMVTEGVVSKTLAKSTLEQMLQSGKSATEILSAEDMKALSEEGLISLCKKAIESSPKAVADYKGGKEKALQVLLGFVMRESGGRANPADTQKKLRELLQ